MSSWLSGCGGAPEMVKSPDPAKVVWGSSEATPSPDAPDDPEATDSPEPAEATGDKSADTAVEIDLDAAPPGESKRRVASAPAKEEEEGEREEEEPEPESPAASEPRVEAPLEKEMRAAVKSKEKKSAKPKKAAAKKSPPAEPAASATPAYAGPNPCKAASFSVARVEEACSKGGRTAAKGVMKDAVGKALAAGTTLRCSDCHSEQRDYTLKPDAVAQLKKWLDG